MNVLREAARLEAVHFAGRSLAAKLKVGKTKIERLRWLLWFSGQRLPQAEKRAGKEFSEIKAQAEYFTIQGGYHPDLGFAVVLNRRQGPKLSGRGFTAADLTSVAREADAAIRNLLQGHPNVLKAGNRPWWRGLSSSFTSSWGGDTRLMFMMAVMDLLEAEGRRIAKCASEACGKFFVRRKRGAYCSRACSQRERTRRYRKKLGQEELAERRHVFYVNQVERQKGKQVAAMVRRRK